jgi:hypothetical protein
MGLVSVSQGLHANEFFFCGNYLSRDSKPVLLIFDLRIFLKTNMTQIIQSDVLVTADTFLYCLPA